MAHLQSDDKSAHIMPLENVGSSSSSGDKLDIVPGYGHERDPRVVADIEDEDNPNVHQKVRTLFCRRQMFHEADPTSR